MKITIGEMLGAASAGGTFRAKCMPIGSPQAPNDLIAIAFSNGSLFYFIVNQMREGSTYDPKTNSYSDDIYETVVVAGAQQVYESLPLGPTPSFRLDWPGGSFSCHPATFEELAYAGHPLNLRLEKALVETRPFAGGTVDFLASLRLTTAFGLRGLRPAETPDFLVFEEVSDSTPLKVWF